MMSIYMDSGAYGQYFALEIGLASALLIRETCS